jgi:probable HAF family extracellular repeat protein
VKKRHILAALASAAPMAFAAIPASAQTASLLDLGALPGGSYSFVNGISADGKVVVGFGASNGHKAFRWTQATGMASIQSGDFAAGAWSSAAGVNADGSVVVGHGDIGGFQNRAFRWTQATGMVNIHGGDFAAGDNSFAYGVNRRLGGGRRGRHRRLPESLPLDPGLRHGQHPWRRLRRG